MAQGQQDPAAVAKGCGCAGAIVLALVLGIAALMSGGGDDGPKAPEPPVIYTGSIVTIQTGSTSPALVGASKADYQDMVQYARAKDSTGLQQMAAVGRLYVVQNGTKARVIDTGIFEIRIRLQDGDYAGREGYVSRDFCKP